LGQQDVPLVVSQHLLWVESLHAGESGFRKTCWLDAGVGAEVKNNFTKITPIAASKTTEKIILGRMDVFFGGQQLLSQSQFCLSGSPV
jgi:hypothetical protein